MATLPQHPHIPPAEEQARPGQFASLSLPPANVLGATLLSILGTLSIWSTAVTLWTMWVNDPLKSIGMFIPAVSLLLILRAWRSIGWSMHGSWSGLALLLATAAAVHFREQSVLVLVLSPRWSIFFPPHSLVALAYVAGCLLLFGGLRLLSAARFPVLLILLVNPVPHIFNLYVDLPLQRVSAHVARGFALALHQKLSPDQMRLMFTPDFGMFIAPGCNGIRGAVTMGILALVIGYLYRFRFRSHVLFVLCAVLLGYLFNFVRLCILVLYYIVALHSPWLQNHAERGDYLIGAALFLGAVYLLFVAVHRLASTNAPSVPPAPVPAPRSAYLSLLAMAVLVLLSGVRELHARAIATQDNLVAATPLHFPATIGFFHLERSWNESLTTGPIIYTWAHYTPAHASSGQSLSVLPIELGLSPVLGAHDSSICHSARGEDPIWHGELKAPTAAGPQTFSASFFNNGATQYLELTTLCTASGCGESAAGSPHLGLIYSHLAPVSSVASAAHRPIPVMLRVETLDTALPADLAHAQLTTAMLAFLKALDLPAIAHPVPPEI